MQFNFTRIVTDEKGDSKFIDENIPLNDSGNIGFLSDPFIVKQLLFRKNEPGYDWDFHNAPAKQFIVLLDGNIEITTSNGEVRTFKGGDVLLVEDVAGKGHATKHLVQQIRSSLLIQL